MIENPHSSLERNHEKVSTHWWQRVKAILFGQWLLSKDNETQNLNTNLKLLDFENQYPTKTTFKDWIQAIDVIQPLVQSLRKSIEPLQSEEFDLDLLATNTYLFHVDRLLVKIREHLHQFRFRQEQYERNLQHAYKVEMNQAASMAEQCYFTIVHLTALLQQTDHKKLYSEEIVSQIHALELDTTSLGGAIRTLNQSAYKAESMAQLAALEQDLLQSLTQSKQMYTASSFSEGGMRFNLSHTQGELLRAKAQLIIEPNLNRFINGLIDIHEQLKKCYVVARKVFIKDSLEEMSCHIEELITALNNQSVEKSKVFYHLNKIFHCVEAIRFNTNRESRCSRNLFEKSRICMQNLRKLCQKHPLGVEYLNEFSIKRIGLLKKPK